MGVAKVTLNGTTLMDTTGMTVTSNAMVSATTALDKAGNVVTGAIATKTSNDITVNGSTITVPAGVYNTAATKSVASAAAFAPAITLASSTGVVTGTNTFAAGYYSASTKTSTFNLTTQAAKTVTPTETAQTAVSSYRWTTGSVTVAGISSNYVGTNVPRKSSNDLTVSGSVVSGPIGYYSQAFSRAIDVTASIGATISYLSAYNTIRATGVVSSAGYATAGDKGTYDIEPDSLLPVKVAATYTPTTTNQTIASQRWLTGTQTILGDANLVASNIASGVSIFGVTGTHEGGTNNTYTVTISGTGDSSYCYIQYNNTKYYTNGNTFTFTPGDTIIIYGYSLRDTATIQENNIVIEMGIGTFVNYTYTLPYGDITIALSGTGTNNTKSIKITTASVLPNYYLGNSTSAITGSSYTISGRTFIASNYTLTTTYNSYAAIYQSLAYRSMIASNATNVSDWADSLTSIGSSQFAGQTFSGTFNFNNVTSISALGFAFPSRPGATQTIYNFCSLNFPKITTIPSAGFISNVNLSSISGSSCSYISAYAFQNCVNLISVSFPNCTDIHIAAFSNCNRLTNISFSKCTAIPSYAFYQCFSLETVSIPNATYISGYAFNNCTKLISINFPQCSYISASAFAYCTSLNQITLSSCTLISSYAFFNCSSLITITLPMAQSFGGYAFGSCSGITMVSIPQCITLHSSAFRDCRSLMSIYLGSSIPTLSGYTVFYGTPMSDSSYTGAFGSIYVPTSMVNAYRAATNWVTFSSRITGY